LKWKSLDGLQLAVPEDVLGGELGRSSISRPGYSPFDEQDAEREPQEGGGSQGAHREQAEEHRMKGIRKKTDVPGAQGNIRPE
jgi:hypothetical protein